jgi:hypothetical protein
LPELKVPSSVENWPVQEGFAGCTQPILVTPEAKFSPAIFKLRTHAVETSPAFIVDKDKFPVILDGVTIVVPFTVANPPLIEFTKKFVWTE